MPNQANFITGLKDRKSDLRREVIAEITKRLQDRISRANLAGWPSFTVKLEADIIHTRAESNARLYITMEKRGQVYAEHRGTLRPQDLKGVTRQKMIRSIASQAAEGLFKQLIDSHLGSFRTIGIDRFVFNWYSQWLKPWQILELVERNCMFPQQICDKDGKKVARIHLTNQAYIVGAQIHLDNGAIYDGGQFILTGTFVRSMADSLQGRDISTIIESPLIPSKTVHTVTRHTRNLRLNTAVDIMPISDLRKKAINHPTPTHEVLPL